jgi:hypothetical protein
MQKDVSRKKFIAWVVGLGSLAFVPAAFRLRPGKKNKTTTAKMLTRDGKLVEIDIANIPAKRKKLGIADIHGWIRKKNSM